MTTGNERLARVEERVEALKESVEVQLEAVLRNQEQSRERQHTYANAVQGLSAQMAQILKEMREHEKTRERVADLEQTRDRQRTTRKVFAVIGSTAAGAFTIFATVGEYVVKIFWRQ